MRQLGAQENTNKGNKRKSLNKIKAKKSTNLLIHIIT